MFRDVPFVGREYELGVLRAALTSASGGRGRVVLLVGEPGIGKSRTAEELGSTTRAAGAEVLVGRCYEGEGAPAFWPWLQVLEAYVAGRDATTLAAELGTAAADVAVVCPAVRARLPELPPAPGGDPAHARFRFFDGVTRALGRAAAARPVVLVLDDLHGADRPSLLLLQFLARALPAARMLVVGALRDVALAAEHPLAEALGELVREGGSEWLRLRGLDEAAVAALIETMAGLPPPAGLAAAVHARTDGNPLFVTEVVRALVAAGPLHPVPPDEVWRLPVPDTVRATIARRLGQRSAGCREVLTLAALFGREFQVDALTRASGRDAREVLGAVDEAEAARLVTARPAVRGRYRFVHALVNETLVDALGPGRRSALHREAAAALAADPRAEELAAEIAHHYHAAGPAGDPAAAVAWAARAGKRALERLAYEEAARLYRLALDALGWGVPDVPREAELLLGLGDACKRAGDVVAAKASFLRAAELGRRLGAPELLTRAALGFAPTVTYAEQPAPDAAVTSLLEEAIAAWGEQDSGLHACALARLAQALFFGDPVRRSDLIERAVAMARRLDDAAALRQVLASRLALHEQGYAGHQGLALATELATLAEAAADGEALALARVWRCAAFVERGDVVTADAELTALARLAETLRQPVWAWRAHVRPGDARHDLGTICDCRGRNRRGARGRRGSGSTLQRTRLLHLAEALALVSFTARPRTSSWLPPHIAPCASRIRIPERAHRSLSPRRSSGTRTRRVGCSSAARSRTSIRRTPGSSWRHFSAPLAPCSAMPSAPYRSTSCSAGTHCRG